MAEIVVTDEAAERAAKAFWEGEGGAGSPWDWAELNERDPYKAGVYRREAKVMMEAAAPLLQVRASAEHGVCNACGWEGDAEHDLCPKCGLDELNYYFTPRGAPAPVQVDREALRQAIWQSLAGTGLTGIFRDELAEAQADAALALLSPEETK